jgi:carbamate kinase
MRALAAEGHFASGSMGPKVDAVCRFVEDGGGRAVITSLEHIVDAVTGSATDNTGSTDDADSPASPGTVVVPN